MRMDGLARLHASMKTAGIERARFRVRHNHLTFESVFLTDTQPFSLGMACLAPAFVLLFPVQRGYEIALYIEPRASFDALMAALRQGGGGAPFNVKTFLGEIDAALPAAVSPRDRAWPSDLARFRRDVHEADKIHLCGWWPHPAGSGHNVSARNLAKTLEWLGRDAHDWCKRNNVSTRWTDEQSLALKGIDKPNWAGYR